MERIAAKHLRQLRARLKALRLMQEAGAARYDANLPKESEFSELNPHFYKDLIERGNLDVFPMLEYFWVFDLLTMQDGYELDFVYIDGGSGSHPRVYARKTSEPRLVCPSYDVVYGGSWNPRPIEPYVKVTPSPLGYFQLAMFQCVVDKFYLVWHAAKFDSDVMLNRFELEEHVERPLPVSLSDDDFLPKVTLSDELATVVAIVWRYEDGVSRDTFSIKRATNEMTIVNSEIVIAYDRMRSPIM